MPSIKTEVHLASEMFTLTSPHEMQMQKTKQYLYFMDELQKTSPFKIIKGIDGEILCSGSWSI